jgi:ABC-type multidrug transport system fused ATPase/permease subunit
MQIRTHEYVVEELLNMTKSEFSSDAIAGQIQNISFSFRDKIELRNVFFAYDGQPLIFKNASLVIRKGEKIIIQGRSGSGKTTLFLILMRFLKEHLGDILIDGEKTDDKELLALRKKIAYVPQNPYIVDASVIENIAFGIPLEEIQFEKARAIAQSLNLADWVEGLSAKWNTIIGEKGTRISGGQRQRLAIARALYHEAEIFLLDEITNQLDKESEQSVLNAINVLASQHKTIILITHKTELFENFDSVYELNDENFIKINQSISISR